MRAPGGFELLHVNGATLFVRAGLADFMTGAVREHGTLRAWSERNSLRALEGRTTAHVVDIEGSMGVVRHYVRGGSVASGLGDRYLRAGSPRPYRELWISELARAREVPAPAVLAAAIYTAGLFYRGDLVTEFIAGAEDLATLSVGERRRDTADRLAAWRAAGRMLHRIAIAGFVHADLNLRNVLIAWRSGEPEAWVIDLDRARVRHRASPADLDAMVKRLHQSAAKFERQSATSLRAELAALDQSLRE